MTMQTSKACDLDEIAAEIRARGDRTGRRILVGVDGPGASGKSTLAALLAERLPDTLVVHVDDFYRPSADERPGGLGADFDLERLERQVLRPAFAGETARYQRYDWESDRLAEWHDIPAGIPLVIEGVYSTRAGVRDLYTYRVYCHAPHELRLSRGLERDGAAAESQWVDEWMPAEDRYTHAERPYHHADLVLDGTGTESADGPVFHRAVLS
jgi:uridine kinase